jgi:Flp pilus assembly pilin Flp
MLQAYATWATAAVSGLRGWVRGRVTEMTGSERGGVAAEYALLISLIAVALVVGAFFVGSVINQRLNDTGTCIQGAPANGGC